MPPSSDGVSLFLARQFSYSGDAGTKKAPLLFSDRGGGDHHRVCADRNSGTDGDESTGDGADVDVFVFGRSNEAEQAEREGEGADQEGALGICLLGSQGVL